MELSLELKAGEITMETQLICHGPHPPNHMPHLINNFP